ncbi:MAG: hypothetical protein ACRED0_03065 [Gammaproteobacteria bacterium]
MNYFRSTVVLATVVLITALIMEAACGGSAPARTPLPAIDAAHLEAELTPHIESYALSVPVIREPLRAGVDNIRFEQIGQ